jgi:hypothetical protein
MSVLLDIIYTCLHYLIIGINVLAWIPQRTRRLHLITISLTLFSWIVLGFWYGFGYCFLTDWQWDVKRELGERNLPGSFIQYQLVEVFGWEVQPELTDIITLLVFIAAVCIALWQHLLPHIRRIKS